jgi:DNA-binding MarR family transcriptional regulator
MSDRVETMREAWRRELPALDLRAMGVILRILLCGRHLEGRVARSLAPQELQPWEFDVLAALRRQGGACELTAGDLARHVMLTCSGMTHRVDRLVKRGLVRRRPDQTDRRSIVVALTERGRALVEDALQVRSADGMGLLERALDDVERQQLERLLARLLEALEADADGAGCIGSALRSEQQP